MGTADMPGSRKGNHPDQPELGAVGRETKSMVRFSISRTINRDKLTSCRALAWHVYLAATFIIDDMKHFGCGSQGSHAENDIVGQGIYFLDSVRARNEMAGNAADILRELLNDRA